MKKYDYKILIIGFAVLISLGFISDFFMKHLSPTGFQYYIYVKFLLLFLVWVFTMWYAIKKNKLNAFLIFSVLFGIGSVIAYFSFK
jgi:hypothetical protein